MAANDVEIRLKAADAEVVQAWIRCRQGIEATGQELDKVGKKGAKAGKDIAASMQGVVGDLGQATLAMVGIGSAVQALGTFVELMRKEFENLKARQSEAAGFQVSRSVAIRKMTTALGPQESGGLQPEEAVALIEKKAVQLGVSQIPLLRAAEAGFGAGGSLDPRQVMEGIFATAKFFPELAADQSGHEMRAGSEGVLEIMKRFGKTAEESAAAFAMVSRASRGVSAEYTARSTLPSLGEMYEMGGKKDSFNFLASLNAGVGQVAGDASGKKTRTGLTSFIMQLRAETAMHVGKDSSVEEMYNFIRGDSQDADKVRKKLTGVLGLNPRELAELRKRGEASNDGDLKGEAQLKTAFLQILTPGENSTTKEIAAAKGKVGNADQADVQQVAGWNARVNKLDSMQAEGLSRAETGIVETDYSDVDLAMKGQLSSLLTKSLRHSGGAFQTETEIQSTLSDFENISTSGLDAATNVRRRLQAKQGDLRDGTRIYGGGGYSGGSGFSPATEADLRAADKLQPSIDALGMAIENLTASRDKPMPVEIAGDKRPQPQTVTKPPAAQLSK